MRRLQDGEDTGRYWWWEGIIERPYRLSRGYLLDLRNFLDVWNEPTNITTTIIEWKRNSALFLIYGFILA